MSLAQSNPVVETTWIVPVALLKSNVHGAPLRTLVLPFPMLSPVIAEESCSKLLVRLITYQVLVDRSTVLSITMHSSTLSICYFTQNR